MITDRPVILAFDFDGTITMPGAVFPEFGELNFEYKELINRLYNEGYYIIIWTCRGEYSLITMIDYLNTNEIKYDKINENAPFGMLGIKPFPKVYADFYIDDRNLGGLWDFKAAYELITGKRWYIH